jgi:hypothetical protein
MIQYIYAACFCMSYLTGYRHIARTDAANVVVGVCLALSGVVFLWLWMKERRPR